MTTIGTAVLQIIPSLLGVSEAIEKQIDGKVVEVKVAPKVDPAAAKKAGQDAGTTVAKSANDAAAKTPIQPKVDKTATARVGKEAGESITKGAKDAVTKGDIGKLVSDDITQSVKKSSPGKDLAKIIVDGIATGAKQEMRAGSIAEVIVGGLAEGVKQGIDGEGVGGQIVDVIGDGVKSGNLGGTIKDAVLPTIKNIGTEIRNGATAWAGDIANSLRSGDIQGATDEISNTVRTTTNTIATIGETFGLQLDDVRSFGGDVANILTEAGGMGSAITNTVDQVKGISQAFGLMGPAAEKAAALTNTALSLIVIPEIGKEINDKIQDYLKDNHPDLYTANNSNTPDQLGAQARAWFDHQVFTNPDAKPTPVPVGQLPQTGSQSSETPTIGGIPIPGLLPRKAGGGQIKGPGTGISDSILAMVSNKEFIVNADATRKNLTLLEAINSGKIPGFAGGGLVGPDVSAATALAGTKYSQGARTDCSGMVARVIDRTLGMPEGGLMSTKSAAEWLKARGFVKGTGGPGQISVGWYDHGPNPNDGHMAMTLSDGRNAESGGSSGPFTIGGKAAGASSPQFDQHMFLPTLYGEGPAGSSSAAAPASAGGSSSAGSSAAPASSSSSGGGGAAVSSSSGGGGSLSLPSTISGLAGFGLDGLGPKTKAGPNSPERTFDIGSVAADAIGGQVSSALGVFGVGDAPPFLNALSTLVGGISVGGNSAAPTSASSSFGGTPPPDEAHGTQAGQAPGPNVSYTINSRDVNDGFVQATRIQKEKSAAKLAYL